MLHFFLLSRFPLFIVPSHVFVRSYTNETIGFVWDLELGLLESEQVQSKNVQIL